MNSLQKHTKFSAPKRFAKKEGNSFKKPFFSTAILYLVASICQLGWLWLIIQNFDQVKRWVGLPVIGWVMVAVYIAIVIVIPLLFVIGLKLLILVKKTVMISLTDEHIRNRKTVNMLLIVGIIADLVFSSLIIFGDIKDKSAIPYLLAMFGARVLQANFEAVALYFSVINKKEKPTKEVTRTRAN